MYTGMACKGALGIQTQNPSLGQEGPACMPRKISFGEGVHRLSAVANSVSKKPLSEINRADGSNLEPKGTKKPP